MIANHYNDNNRSVSGRCHYRTDDGRMCAVGMCMNDEGIYKFGDSIQNVCAIARHLNEKCQHLDDILKDEYKGHDAFFWNELQILHDNSVYWNEHGISNRGKLKVSELINKQK